MSDNTETRRRLAEMCEMAKNVPAEDVDAGAQGVWYRAEMAESEAWHAFEEQDDEDTWAAWVVAAKDANLAWYAWDAVRPRRR